MEVSGSGVSAPGSIQSISAQIPPRPGRSARRDPFRPVPSFSPPTATYGPRGEFPRPLLIALSFPVPVRAPFAGILPRAEGAARDPDPPAAYRGRLAASFVRSESPRAIDAVR